MHEFEIVAIRLHRDGMTRLQEALMDQSSTIPTRVTESFRSKDWKKWMTPKIPYLYIYNAKTTIH